MVNFVLLTASVVESRQGSTQEIKAESCGLLIFINTAHEIH